MAKLSVIARDNKKEALVKRYAEKRKALKAAGNYAALDKLHAVLPQFVCTVVANSREGPVVIWPSLVFAVTSSANWLTKGRFPE